MSYFIDVKITTWERYFIPDDAAPEVLAALERGGLRSPSEIYDICEPDWADNVGDSEWVDVNDNHGHATLELYNDDESSYDPIASNSARGRDFVHMSDAHEPQAVAYAEAPEAPVDIELPDDDIEETMIDPQELANPTYSVGVDPVGLSDTITFRSNPIQSGDISHEAPRAVIGGNPLIPW